VTYVDFGALAIYCQAHARWRRAEEAIQQIAKEDPENGGLVLVTTNGNIVQNPLVGIANSSMRDAIRYGAEFGLTPSSRAGLGIMPTQPFDPVDKYFD
jgi:P27 family predicted phage terminase small subunit